MQSESLWPCWGGRYDGSAAPERRFAEDFRGCTLSRDRVGIETTTAPPTTCSAWSVAPSREEGWGCRTRHADGRERPAETLVPAGETDVGDFRRDQRS